MPSKQDHARYTAIQHSFLLRYAREYTDRWAALLTAMAHERHAAYLTKEKEIGEAVDGIPGMRVIHNSNKKAEEEMNAGDGYGQEKNNTNENNSLEMIREMVEREIAALNMHGTTNTNTTSQPPAQSEMGGVTNATPQTCTELKPKGQSKHQQKQAAKLQKQAEGSNQAKRSTDGVFKKLSLAFTASTKNTDNRLSPPHFMEDGLKNYYPMDLASALPALALQVNADDDVLDMTAAPGGKTLVLLSGETPNSIQSNELDPDRRIRLRRVIDDYVDPNIIIPTVTGKDATRMSSFPSESYSKVLLDAPCSTERHLIQSMMQSDRSGNICPEMMSWSPRTPIRCHELQVRLLLKAIDCCRIGGRICYSTCSISETENDGVIRKVLQDLEKKALKGRRKLSADNSADNDNEFSTASIDIVRRSWPFGEATELGWLVLPDQCHGWGPIYLCVIERTG